MGYFYFIVMNKKPRNKAGERHGTWEFYNSNGLLFYMIRYKNGKKEGYSEYYFPSGRPISKKFYAR